MGYQRVVGLGLCVVDHTYLVDTVDAAAVRARFTRRLVACGGMTGTALRQAAALGCRTQVLSVLGADADGRFVRRCLREAGVDTRRLLLSPRCETTVAVVLVERGSGERRFIVPDRRELERSAPALDLSIIRKGSLLLVDGHFPEQALRAVARAREVGATVIADLHRPRPQARRLLRHVDHAIVSEEYARAAGHSDPEQALRALARETRGSPVLTLGRRGGLYLEGGRVRRFPAHRVRVVDTTGAGDVFHGAFAAGLYHGLDLRASLALAARAAARNCTALGGAGRLTTPGELPRAMRPAAARASPGR